MDASRYFWQGEKVRLRPLREGDAETGLETLTENAQPCYGWYD